ncbi:putative fatty acyl-CoA reductase CG8306 [Uranotaenia lowii]|uniref:putative fatty acyl-CoA reductase CG8306 n=1 Tax=Uranotaenia lowii TaxID=190385 RepID=UPI002478D235|nr:putative fatty acyl-CoA reductase CG8306 [Uranotaenia lowii]XP_055602546.1 putative fatty acyl-CoA reductase CG8306 [Uranotaenia lowii]
MSSVQSFYKNKNIFITGGTGFLGIAIVEKILRSCPDVGGIYLLMRPKKGKNVAERLQEITTNAIFETLLQQVSDDIFKKLHAVAGDVGEENLGLSLEDRSALAKTIDVVIHSAATLDFQATLKPTVQINLLGTRRVMQLCREMQNLKCMVHVSSAYVNAFLKETEERLYPTHESAEKIIDLVNTLSEDALDELTDRLLKDHPNTYTFTKHLAEHEVDKCASIFPCGIVRPSMITGAWKEPVPGWTISKNGPQGFLMGAAKGIIRRLPVGTELICDYIPVDTVVNQILVTGYYIADRNTKQISIFHCTSSTCNPFKWDSVKDKVNEYLHKYPLKSAVWYPHLKFVPSLWLYKISAILVHFLPAYLLDFVTKICGGRPILVRLHTNVWESLNRLEKFIFSEWKFNNAKTLELSRQLTEKDRTVFEIDITSLQWPEYFVNLAQGVRRYLNNEHPKSLEAARKKDSILLIVHILFQALIVALLWFIISKAFGIPTIGALVLVPVLYGALNLL